MSVVSNDAVPRCTNNQKISGTKIGGGVDILELKAATLKTKAQSPGCCSLLLGELKHKGDASKTSQ